jgi:hypothetical protein
MIRVIFGFGDYEMTYMKIHIDYLLVAAHCSLHMHPYREEATPSQ